MDVLYIASQMVMLSLPIALGYAVHKAGIMNDEVDHNLSRIVLEVALPCLIIASVGSVDELPDARTIAVVLVLAGVNDLGIVGGALDIVGQLTTPAALLIIGSSLARYDLSAMFGNPRAYLAAACRLLVIPLAAAVLLHALGIDPTVVAVVVIGVGMPVATNGTLYCLQYGVDMKPMIQTTFLSVVGSIATIPLLVAVL